jgi:rhodanese-related sulfurtransferase
MPSPTTITLSDLTTALRTNDADEFWNVLTEEYFAGELIPGSRWVALDRVGREAGSLGLAKDARIIVYCSGPTCPNSGDAGVKLATLGFTNVRVFAGGLEVWKNSGRGVEVLPRAKAA